MNAFCSMSSNVWGRLTFSVLQLRNLHLTDKAWQGNIKSTITEYSQYFHGREGISSSQRSIQEAKLSPHTYPVLNYCCKEPFFMLNHWKAYDEIILITSWACQVICSFRRYEICRQPWFEGSPGETSCWHNYVWRNYVFDSLSQGPSQQFWTADFVQCTTSSNDASLQQFPNDFWAQFEIWPFY